MALRKMTFAVPEATAEQLVKQVPAGQHSGYVAEAIAHKPNERDRQLIRACEAANEDADILAIERDLDALKCTYWRALRLPALKSA
jgi:hypothetical protein